MMKIKQVLLLVVLQALLLCSVSALAENSCGNRTVTYDHRAIVINGVRRVLISGAIHYPRSTPEMWPDLIAKAKAGGLNAIETYVFWNMHEPTRGTYNFEGRFDLIRFIKIVQDAGLYLTLRIGPYACAEWNYGGFPMWLHFIEGIAFRTDNEPFKNEMQRFTSKIVDMLKQENLLYQQGGPIILAQIENEYGNVASHYGAPGKAYTKWAAQMAVSLDIGVPWVMCQQADAPAPTINTCNGFYCDGFKPNSNNTPTMWTENWNGWFLEFGGAKPHRPIEDVAYSVARFYERGGTFQNYYMYHGGTNFGRTSGGPFIATSYDYDAPIDEYGNLYQPKWGHLKDLHQAIMLCEPALVSSDPAKVSLGSKQEVHVYTNGGDICSAFLANNDKKADATVNFRGQTYHLPAWSVSILPDCKNVVYNTAQINAQTSKLIARSKGSEDGESAAEAVWQIYQEPIGDRGANSFTSNTFLEQINTTKDSTDYLWYSTSVDLSDDDLIGSGDTNLSFAFLGHSVHVFVNNELSGSATGFKNGNPFRVHVPVKLKAGSNKVDLLSMTVGLQNYGAFFDTWGAGIKGDMSIDGLKTGSRNISFATWVYQIGLQGEDFNIYSNDSINWTSVTNVPVNQSVTWYKTTFDAPAGNGTVALDLSSMGKGVAYINGESIGRYWPAYLAPQTGCSSSCSYQGRYDNNKCTTNCGMPSQTRYHVPRAWLKETGNTLVLFEEIGGDPSKADFVTSSVDTVCAHVSQSHSPPIDNFSSVKISNQSPIATIDCGAGRSISSITFASYGTPKGTCGNFEKSSCHASHSVPTVEKACLGQRSCSVTVSNANFKQDPCHKAIKSLAVEALCS